MGIKGRFDFGHYVQQIFAELFTHEFSAGDADAVLTGERAFELEDQG